MTEAKEPLVYSVRHPEGLTPDEGYPLLLLLHGYGSNEQDLMGLSPYLDARFLLVSVRAPHPLDTGGYAWFPLDFTPQGLVPDFAQAVFARRQLVELLDELKSEYPVDPAQVFLLGFSQGASMAVGLGLGLAEAVSAVVSLSGYCPPEVVPEVLASGLEGLPVFMTHGLYDPVIPIGQGQESRDVVARLPVALEYREYPMGHEINTECLQDLVAWLAGLLNEKNKKA
jgi:phospholipase/carboxylesterase